MISDWIHIPANVPSLKNGKVIAHLRPKGKKPIPRLVPSKRHREYKKGSFILWKAARHKFHKQVKGLNKPYYVAMFFVRDSRRLFDFTNACDTVQDLMVEAGWVDDDNVEQMIPYFAGYRVNKETQGVYIKALSKEPSIPIPPEEHNLFT